MMMNIGDKIAHLRATMGVTQEQLAQAVGVSAPAVSKWESGKSCPDIALLRPIARYFGVSTDMLLDYEPELTDSQLDELDRQCRTVFSEEGWTQGLARVQALDKEYPGNCALQLRLMGALELGCIYAPDDQSVTEAKQMELNLLERAVTTSDPILGRLSRFLLATVLMTLDRTSEAREMLQSISQNDGVNPEIMLPTLHLMEGDFDGAEKAAQQMLLVSLGNAILSLVTLTKVGAKTGRFDRAKNYAQAQQDLAELFHLTRLHGGTIGHTWEVYAKATGDEAELLRGIEMAAKAMLNLGGSSMEGSMFDQVEIKKNGDTKQAKAIINVYLTQLENDPDYQSLNGNPQFEAVKKMVQAAYMPN